MTIGQKIKKTRTELGFSPKQLAEKSGMDLKEIALIENDKHSSFGISKLIDIARVLAVDCHYLLDEKSELERPKVLWCGRS